MAKNVFIFICLIFTALLFTTNTAAADMFDDALDEVEQTSEYNAPEAKAAFNFPDIIAGTIWDAKKGTIEPFTGIEIFDKKNIVSNIGVAPSRVIGTLGYRFTSVFEISAFVFGGEKVSKQRNEFIYGVGVGIIKF